MPATVYESMFLLDTNKVAGDIPSATKTLHGLLERHQAEIQASRPWDERRLAYPIKGHKKGLYYLTCFRAEGKVLPTIERDCSLSELILRQMILRIEDKLVDSVLQMAQDEHAVALQTVQEQPGDEDMDDDRQRRGGGGRRPVESGKD